MDVKALHFENRKQWREWLEGNHDTESEAWLVHFKKRSATTSVSLDDAVEEAICFGWIDSKLMSIDKERFLLRYTPRKGNSVWSKINKERAERLIASGQMTDAGMATIVEARKRGMWETAYSSRSPEGMPSDLKAALAEGINALDNFEKLAGTYRTQYIAWVNDARTEETRRKRVTEVVRRSTLNQKPETRWTAGPRP
jgi:uncharacterized protein YdeI (YjbR/CyaY-like superfamily)